MKGGSCLKCEEKTNNVLQYEEKLNGNFFYTLTKALISSGRRNE